MNHHQRLVAAKGLLYTVAVALVPCALVFTPGQAMAVLMQEPQRQQPKPDQQPPNTPQQGAKSVVVTGTIVKNGSDFVLKDTSGTVYRLDAPGKAEPFEGKSVKVTGQLDANASLPHVESIEATTA
jgi:hypothetical protein